MDIGELAGVTGSVDVRALAERLVKEYPPGDVPDEAFLNAQYDAGLAWVHFPIGKGGRGLVSSLQQEVDILLASRGAPSFRVTNSIGFGMAAPTVLALGSEDQQERFLRPLFTGREIWCQLFSEPDAGSDVASLATSARRTPEGWIINGEKVWTSLAHTARRGLLLARTDPSVPKHAGLTYFVVDMQSRGVEIMPLRQMTGDAEFNQVFFRDAVVEDRDRLTEEGGGWKGAIVTLMNERVAIGGNDSVRSLIQSAFALWRSHVRNSDAAKDRLVRLWIESEILRMMNAFQNSNGESHPPGPEGSVAKLLTTELIKRVTEFSLDLSGAEGMLYDSYEMRRPSDPTIAGGAPPRSFLRARANSIEGGSSEIQRNILAERVLGLPKDPSVDRDLPWARLRRSV